MSIRIRCLGIEARLTLVDVPPSHWSGFAGGWAALGATHLTIDTMGAGLEHATDHIAALRETIRSLRADGI